MKFMYFHFSNYTLINALSYMVTLFAPLLQETINPLVDLGKIAGIAGISVGVLFLIFRGIIQKNIFPNLTKEQAYSVIRMIIVACSVIALVGIGAWVYGSNQSDDLKKIEIRGSVTSESGSPVKNARIQIRERPEADDHTDSKGNFVFSLKGKGTQSFHFITTPKGQEAVSEIRTIDFSGYSNNIDLKPLVVNIRETIEPVKNEGGQEKIELMDPKELFGEEYLDGIKEGTITLKYMGDYLDCNLNLNINIAGKAFNPNSNPFTVSGIPTGARNYSIAGNISCGYENCSATGQGTLFIQNNGIYYVMWNYNTCEVGLYSQADYNRLKGL